MSGHRVPFDLFNAQNKRMKDPGASGTIKVDRDFAHVPLVSAAAEARTLAAPTQANLHVLLYMKTDGGDITLTVTGGYDEAGSTTATFSATGQWMELVSVEEGSNIRWRVVRFDGVTGPTETFGTISAAGNISSAGSIKSTSATGGVGYATGAGGAVTQATSASTGVTLNKVTGQITTVALTTAAGAEERFTVTNSSVAATDVVVLGTTYDGNGTPLLSVQKIAAGAFDIVISNAHASAEFNAAMVINFSVIKGVAA